MKYQSSLLFFKHRRLRVSQFFTAILINCRADEEATETCVRSVHSHCLNLICASNYSTEDSLAKPKAGLGNSMKNKNSYLSYLLAWHYYNQKASSRTASNAIPSDLENAIHLAFLSTNMQHDAPFTACILSIQVRLGCLLIPKVTGCSGQEYGISRYFSSCIYILFLTEYILR